MVIIISEYLYSDYCARGAVNAGNCVTNNNNSMEEKV